MSKVEERNNRGYSKFDDMSTEALQEMLLLDSQLSDNEEPDMDAILYIMNVIAKREMEEPTVGFIDTEHAWQSFNENYEPFSSDGKSLYEDDEDTIETYLQVQRPILVTAKVSPYKKYKNRLLRVASVAAAIFGIVCTGSVTAYALGYDPWTAVATWTQETFGFVPADNAQEPDFEMLEELERQKDLEDFKMMTREYGVPSHMLPSYLPDGYEVVDIKSEELTTVTRLYCQLENSGKTGMIQYSIYTSGEISGQYQKDQGDPVEHVVGNITYYIMTNSGVYFTVWQDGNTEGYISGLDSQDEIIKVINSIVYS